MAKLLLAPRECDWEGFPGGNLSPSFLQMQLQLALLINVGAQDLRAALVCFELGSCYTLVTGQPCGASKALRELGENSKKHAEHSDGILAVAFKFHSFVVLKKPGLLCLTDAFFPMGTSF